MVSATTTLASNVVIVRSIRSARIYENGVLIDIAVRTGLIENL